MNAITKDPRFPAYVWEAPVRVWHWTMALAMVVLVVTGFLVSYPPSAGPGEASENFIFGYVRFAHFAAGYIFTLAFVYRLAWAFMGNKYSREIFLMPLYVFRASWWRDLIETMKHYLFIRRDAPHFIGHNPIAMAAMFAMYVLGTVFMIVTGFALYGEGLGRESWAFKAFSSWVIPLFGQSQDVHTWHHVGMWYLIWFTMVHLYFATRENLTSGLTVIGSMVNGWRRTKDG